MIYNPRFPDIGQHFHTVRRASSRCNPSLQLPPSPDAACLLTSTPWIEAIFTISNPQLEFRVLLLSLNRIRLLSAHRLLLGRADEHLASPSRKPVRASNRFLSGQSQVVSFHPSRSRIKSAGFVDTTKRPSRNVRCRQRDFQIVVQETAFDSLSQVTALSWRYLHCTDYA